MAGQGKLNERAVLVHVDVPGQPAEEYVGEFVQLAVSAGLSVAGTSTAGIKQSPQPKLLIGAGKAEEIRDLAADVEADVVIFSHALSPSQERNLERVLQRRVIDRTGLILDIFAQRATTFEGKLQVELAQLQHLSTRLIRGWTHLERQRGGIGLRGPGETQLETDRRLIRNRIGQLHRRIEHVRQGRELAQRARRRAERPVIALVGYTNAGKSTLFNRLTGAAGYTADRLFATLDPTVRRVNLPGLGWALFGDTVGFIRDLPHDLVAAFRATLEQVVDADLLLHVIDGNPQDRDQRTATVNEVIADLGAGEVPQIEVYNKADQYPVPGEALLEAHPQTDRLWVSARTGVGVEALLTAIVKRLQPEAVNMMLRLSPECGRLRAELYALGVVAEETFDERGDSIVGVAMTPEKLRRLLKDDTCARVLVAGARTQNYDAPLPNLQRD